MKTPREYASEAAKLLTIETPNEWTATTDGQDWYAYAKRSDGLTLHFNTSHQHDKRLGISMSLQQGSLYTHYSAYRDSVPSITVALTKTTGQIVSDITRRLLPDAEKLYATLLERKTASDNYHTRCDINAQRIIDASEGLLKPTSARDGHAFDAPGWSQSGRDWYMQDCYASENSVQLEFRNLPVDLAVEIVKTIAAYEKKRELKVIEAQEE